MVELALGADAVFLAGHAAFQRAETAQLTFDRHAAGVGDVNHLLGHGDVVIPAGRGLAVFLERAVHHHRGKARLDGAHVDGGRGAVILVHTDRDMGIGFDGGQDQVAQKSLAGIFAGASRGLQDHRAIGGRGGLHDRLDLLHVVHVEGGDAVAVLGRVVEELAHRNEGHSLCLLPKDCGLSVRLGPWPRRPPLGR